MKAILSDLRDALIFPIITGIVFFAYQEIGHADELTPVHDSAVGGWLIAGTAWFVIAGFVLLFFRGAKVANGDEQ